VPGVRRESGEGPRPVGVQAGHPEGYLERVGPHTSSRTTMIPLQADSVDSLEQGGMRLGDSPALASRWQSSIPCTDASRETMVRAVKSLARVVLLPYPLVSDLRSVYTCDGQGKMDTQLSDLE
jgi:hypothetical protein